MTEEQSRELVDNLLNRVKGKVNEVSDLTISTLKVTTDLGKDEEALLRKSFTSVAQFAVNQVAEELLTIMNELEK